MTITIDDNINPTFTQVGPFCNGATITALPLTSTNGITGTWSPAINNTATTLYTFTPDAGQCAATATMTITINPNIVPVFNAIGPMCQNSTPPSLPGTSLNGITGTWSPAAINTAVAGTVTYTFTPDNACSVRLTDNYPGNSYCRGNSYICSYRAYLPERPGSFAPGGFYRRHYWYMEPGDY